jgi:hypothetical protein
LQLQKLVIKYAPPAESKAALALCEHHFPPSELNMDASGALLPIMKNIRERLREEMQQALASY